MAQHVRASQVPLAAAVLALIGLTACAGPVAGTTPLGTATDRLITYQAEVTGVRAGSTADEIILVLDLPAGQPGCSQDPAATVESDERTVWVHTTFVSTVEPEFGVCAERVPQDLPVAIPSLAGRDLSVNSSQLWTRADGTAAFQPCDDTLGCHPPADRCDRAYVELMFSRTEVAPERQVDIVACDGNWMVLEIDAVMTGCQSLDGMPPPTGCAGTGTHARWFATLHPDEGWEVVASGDAAGCADVHATVPDFPPDLCDDLPVREG